MDYDSCIDLTISELTREINRLKDLKLELREFKKDDNAKVIDSGYVIETPNGGYHLDRDYALVKVYKRYSSARLNCKNGKIKKVYLVLDEKDM